jgi:hypothetical protein
VTACYFCILFHKDWTIYQKKITDQRIWPTTRLLIRRRSSW